MFSTFFWGAWNSFCMEQCGGNSLSYLESIGLVSIAYVVYSAIRFAQLDDCENLQQPSTQSFNTPNVFKQQDTAIHNETERAYNISNDAVNYQDTLTSKHQTINVSKTTTLSDLTPQQREALLREVARCCGKPYDCAESKHIEDSAISSSGA